MDLLQKFCPAFTPLPKKRSITAIVAAVIVCTAISGCQSASYMSHRATQFNIAVEKAQNSMLLLNIVRASKRYPMYVTAMSANSESFNPIGSPLGLTLPFGGDATNQYQSTSGLSHGGPTVSMAALDSKEFWNGFLTPIDMERFEYYWKQGWPPSMLLRLVVRDIKFVSKSTDTTSEEYKYLQIAPLCFGLKELENHKVESKVEKPLEYARYLLVIKELTNPSNPMVFRTNQQDTVISNGLDKTDLQGIAALHARGLTISENENGLQLMEKKSSLSMEYQCTLKSDAEALGSGADKLESTFTVNLELGLRSPEAMLYHLGELARQPESKDINPNNYAEFEKAIDQALRKYFDCNSKRDCPKIHKSLLGDDLMQVKTCGYWACRKLEKDNIIVTHEKKNHYVNSDKCKLVEKDGGICPMHALSFVSQMIRLHQSSNELPKTGVGVVRVLGSN